MSSDSLSFPISAEVALSKYPKAMSRRIQRRSRCVERLSIHFLSLVLVAFIGLLSLPDQGSMVKAANYYNDDKYNDYGNNYGADDVVANGDDAAAQDDAYASEAEQYQNNDDDTFHWNENIGFDGVSVMPISCINYNNGHMIKFQLFDSANSYQCHFAEISTFVVSISHYMRAYFNYMALSQGKDFSLPDDAAYLNCIQLETEGDDANTQLYAKIGCMERQTFTSTKLQLHVYTDEQCSQQYEDDETEQKHYKKGYQIEGYQISSKVSFRPPFYSCLSCQPQQISGTFNKKYGTWYDDEYISQYGKRRGQDDDENGDNQDDAVQNDADDDNDIDDQYLAANDDVANNDDGGNNNGRRVLTASKADLQSYGEKFWEEYDALQKNSRSLYDNYYNIGDWNFCERIYKYGVWCDDECRALDLFRTDKWSGADIFLLSIMCTFLTAMMLLVVAKRLKAQQKARIYGDDHPMPGLPPFGMAIVFCVIMAVIITLAKLKFVNETLVFAVVTCILFFIYMLKLTLFENRRPVLLAAPRHDMFDNPLDDHLFT